MNLVQDAMQACMPGTAKQFLGSVQPKPVGQMVMYVAILGLLSLIGYLIGGLIGWGGLTWGLIFGIIMWIGTIAAVIGSGFVLAALSTSIAGRQISNEEAITLVGYAATPVLLIGFIVGILSGLWALGIIGGVLGFLAWLYMAYLIYVSSTVRFGADKAIATTVVVLVAGFVISLIFSAIAGAIVMSMLWSSVMGPLAGYGNPHMMGYGNPYY